MKPKKLKGNEPSTLDKLSASFLKAFQNDFELNGVEAIEKLRKESPAKYAEIASRLIAATEPKSDNIAAVKDMHEVAVILLKRVGVAEVDITPDMIEATLKANDVFIDRLQQICAEAQGQLQ